MTPQFNPSFTVISKFSAGLVEDAVHQYFHMDEELRQFDGYEVGKMWHEMFSSHVDRTHTIPPEMTGGAKITLPHPLTEERMYRQLTDDGKIVLTGVIDCITEDAIYDWKVGSTDAADWAGSAQIPVYALLAEANGYFPDIGHIYRYNPTTKKSDHAVVFLSEETKQLTLDWVTKESKKMYNFLLKHDLFNQLQHRRGK